MTSDDVEKTEFSSRAIEMLNRNEFIGPFLRSKFIPYIPEFDEGVDFILYREPDDVLLKVQLKARWAVDRKYVARSIWMAFPTQEASETRSWHLVPHHVMMKHGWDRHGHTSSWARGHYVKPRLGTEWRDLYSKYETSQLIPQLSRGFLIDAMAGDAKEWPPARLTA